MLIWLGGLARLVELIALARLIWLVGLARLFRWDWLVRFVNYLDQIC